MDLERKNDASHTSIHLHPEADYHYSNDESARIAASQSNLQVNVFKYGQLSTWCSCQDNKNGRRTTLRRQRLTAKSGGKGLCTTLCGTDCDHCKKPHNWEKCHMYGLGVYLADMAQKSHRYVREPERRMVASGRVDQGVGACIRGLNGELWGRVTEEQAKVWLLESGRVAKKETQGIKWQWEPALTSRGVGVCIRGFRGDLWGKVVAEEPTCWRLDSGRIAKKETEGFRWNWEPLAQEEIDVYSMLFCRVCLGNPYLIEGNLLASSGMHDMCWCQDPSEQLETVAEEWSIARGHDTFFVRGLNGAQRAGLGVYNSEYIVFQPFQVLPLYRVDYTLR